MALICSECGFHSPPGMRFCGNCGSPLPGEHGQVNRTAANRFGSELGVLVGSDLKQRFRQAGIESAGQRRIVTVLFADLCDYTGLSSKLDDESLYETIQSYIHMLADIVYQYEGMVDKITGDGLMALFGAPIALENPAERAVRAALEMRSGLEQLNQELEDKLGENLQMHCGLNRGTVIVGGIGSDLLIDYTAIGDAVNLARRLQEAAPPDTILASESVYRTTQALVEYQAAPGLELKGYDIPVPGFQVQGMKSQPNRVRGVPGLHAAMVGRETELDQVLSAMEDMLTTRRGQVVALMGEAGIGKSRLTAEFKAHLDAQRVTVLEGQSLTYRKSVSYWIFLEVIRQFLGASPGSPRAEVQRLLEEKLSHLVGGEFSSLLPLFEKLLNLEPSQPIVSQRLDYLDAEQLRQQNFVAIRNLLLALADHKPLVLILEDLHWADEISLDLLSFLVEAISDRPIMILAVTRPVEESKLVDVLDFSQEQLNESCAIIHLDFLSAEQSDQLLFNLLGMSQIPDRIRSQITSRASGIPFYIEETLRMLIDKHLLVFERGSWVLDAQVDLDLEVPDNLQDLILTRFDRLTTDQRSLLQTASVIGREFNADLLQLVMEQGEGSQLDQLLAELEEKAFILLAGDQSYREYLFRHVLTSDAVYRTLLRKDRSRLHGQVANSIEWVYEDQLEGQVEVLAGHYLRSEYLDKALHYLILAGRKSAREYANQQAQGYFDQARDILPDVEHTPLQAWQVWTGLGDVLVFIGEYEEARSCYREIITSHLDLPAAGPDAGLHVVYRKIATTYQRQGDFDMALDQLEIANQQLQTGDHPSPVAKAQILNDKGWILFLRGSFQEARTALTSALEHVAGSDEWSVIASINNRLGAVSYQLREYKQAALYVRQSLELRKLVGDLSGEARLYNNLGLLELMSGELKAAEGDFNQSINLLEKVGDTEGIALANINLGLVKFELGEYAPAGLDLERAITISKRIGHRFYLGLAELYLGRLVSAEGSYRRAEDLLANSQEIFEELGAEDNLVDVLCYRAENYLVWGRIGSAIQCSEKAYAFIEDEESNLSINSVQSGRVFRLLGSIARRQADLEAAAEYLKESARVFQVAEEKLESARTLFESGLLALDREAPAEAQASFARAREIYTSVGAQKELERLENLLVTVMA